MILKYTLIDLHHNKYYPAHKYSPFLNLCMTLIDGQNNEEVNLYHEVISERRKLNNAQLKREKYNLIKSLKESYDLSKFLSSKVKNYKMYASIYKLFEVMANLEK